MYLILDTETSGLPHRWNAPASDVDNWPRIVQLAWILCHPDGTVVSFASRIVRPDGFEIEPSASATHGMSTRYAIDNGEPLHDVLQHFEKDLQATHSLIAHNIDFDFPVLASEFLRADMHSCISHKNRYCTMKGSADYCKIPGTHGYKWPTLDELYSFLFKERLHDSHDALVDCKACMRCFFRLRELGVM